jgi:hydrogenase maturation protein HypF
MSQNIMKSVIIIVKGTVQGVGFRPFVYRIAKANLIYGDVKNNQTGVIINAYGDKENLDNFIESIKNNYPPLARIKSIEIKEKKITNDLMPKDFIISQSGKGETLEIDISHDTAICADCLHEMFDPKNRRYQHPFINCTNCGPRYTIIKSLPYDRPNTTMKDFEMCNDCNHEYNDPTNKRFHAQPICCNNCGPKLTLIDNKGKVVSNNDPINTAINMLINGKIIAIKGIGGYHISCRADLNKAVKLLRHKKKREEKPFAIMVKDIQTAKLFAHVSKIEEKILGSLEAPIVILKKKEDNNFIAEEVAPNLNTLGIMLPYTPVHHLLFSNKKITALVMTSANFSDEPIIFDDEQALSSLHEIVDAFLTHNRKINIRNDDSIVRVVSDNPVILRRSRGYVPQPLQAPVDVSGLIALGGVLKSTVAIGRAYDCYLSHYIGPIETIQHLENLNLTINHLINCLNVKPKAYVCDLHPLSLVSSFAEKSNLPVIKVQHHHAHAVSCMAENEVNEPAIAIVYDGTGYGLDGKIWGGEILYATYDSLERLGHLSYMLLPGGDMAILNPQRIALSLLYKTIGNGAINAFPDMTELEKQAVIDMIKSNTNCYESAGMGRLFDAVSALLGICVKRSYEGQPAIMLEAIADPFEKSSYGSPLSIEEEGIIIDSSALFFDVYEDLKKGTSVKKISSRFHNTIVEATSACAQIASQQKGIYNICLTGGVFQNEFILSRVIDSLKNNKLNPIVHRRISPNDESISYGQLVIAGFKNKNL